LPLNGTGPHATSYILLLRLFLILGKNQDADTVIDEMLMRLQRLKMVHLRAIVKLLIANGFVKRAREMVDAAVHKFGLGVDMVCCSELVAAYLEDKQMDLVIELIDFMTSMQRFPNVVVYNTIISGLCNMGNTKEAIEVLDNMRYLGVSPNEATYNRIIGGLWINGEKMMAVKMLERMVKEGLSLNVITYNIIVARLSQDGMVDEGLEVARIMKANGISPDVFSYNALLHGFCRAGRMEEAMQVFEEMLDKGCEPHWHTYHIILKGATTFGYKAQVVELLNEMDEKEIISKDLVAYLKDDLLSDHRSGR
jgi:pentatricopeptide repeat protein